MITSILAWWPGDDPNYVPLWWSVKTWGRIGKGMQYVGGLVALIDIIGEERFRSAGDKLDMFAQRLPLGGGMRFGIHLFYSLLFTLVVYALLLALTGWTSLSLLVLSFGAPLIFSILITIRSRNRLRRSYNRYIVDATIRGLIRVPWSLADVARAPVNLKLIGFIIVTIGFGLDFAAS